MSVTRELYSEPSRSYHSSCPGPREQTCYLFEDALPSAFESVTVVNENDQLAVAAVAGIRVQTRPFFGDCTGLAYQLYNGNVLWGLTEASIQVCSAFTSGTHWSWRLKCAQLFSQETPRRASMSNVPTGHSSGTHWTASIRIVSPAVHSSRLTGLSPTSSVRQLVLQSLIGLVMVQVCPCHSLAGRSLRMAQHSSVAQPFAFRTHMWT